MPRALQSQTRDGGPYDLIMSALAKVRVGTISMEYATPVAGGLTSLAQFPENVHWGLGALTIVTGRWKHQKML